MKRVNYALVFSTLLATTAVGCNSTENLYQAHSAMRSSYQSQNRYSGSSGLARLEENRSKVDTSTPATSRLAEIKTSNIQPVAYQKNSGTQPSLALESPPQPKPVPLEKSNLSLTDLENFALQNNPAMAQADARVESAQGGWVQTGLPPNPVLGYSGQQLGSGGQAEQQGVFIGQEFVTGKKLRLNREVAAWEVQRREQELEAIRLRVLTDVRIGYYDVLIAQRRRELSNDLVRISVKGLKAAEALHKGKEVSKADPLRARVEADTARILLQNSVNKHTEAWRRLTAVLGMPDLALQRLDGELKPGKISMSWQDTLQQVLRESPEIAATIADVEAARWAVERAYAEVIPNIDVQAVIQDDRGTGSTNGNLQVTLPIPFWNRNQGGIRQAEADVAAAEKAVDRLTMDLQTRLATAFQRYESARNQVDQYSRKGGILENAGQTLELIRSGYKAEEFGVLDLLTAQRTYFQTNLSYLDSLRELWKSTMEIRGQLLHNSLSK